MSSKKLSKCTRYKSIGEKTEVGAQKTDNREYRRAMSVRRRAYGVRRRMRDEGGRTAVKENK